MIKILKRQKKILVILFLTYLIYKNSLAKSKFKKKSDYFEEICKIPEFIDNNNFTNFGPIGKCSIEKNWGYIDEITNTWYLNEDIRLKYNSIECVYRKIIRIDDFNVNFDEFKKLENGSKINDDVFEVKCNGKNSLTNSVGSFYNLYTQIVNDEIKQQQEKKQEPNNDGCFPFDVILLSYDSVSRVLFKQRLKKTYNLIKENKNFYVLNGYNIVGDGTPAALIPIYTGKTEEELPSALKNDPNGKYVDEVYPFLWKELHQKNYTSIYLDDWPHVGAFTYRMRGFKNQTPKHYPKHFQIRIRQLIKKRLKKNDFCMGDTKTHKIVINMITNFKRLYHRKQSNIAFMHYVENSHDDSSHLHWIDDDIYEFLSTNLKENLFENTILFLYSDHGSRFNKERSSQRYLEERLPFFSVYLPDSFTQKYPKKFENFLKNKDKLTSPFDINESVRDLTCLPRNKTDTRSRSISLFEEISLYRSCEDIGIRDHFCTCEKNWKNINKDSEKVLRIADFVVQSLNFITFGKRDLCQLLGLKQIISAEKLSRPNKNLYRVSFMTLPNNGIYETIVHEGEYENFEFTSKHFSIESKADISRIDAYGSQPWCVANFGSNPGLTLDLRKFCYCFPKNSKNKKIF